MFSDTPFWRSIRLFLLISVFGACLPFIVAGSVMTKDEWRKVPDLQKYGVKKPFGIDDITRENASQTDLEITARQDRPTYSKLILDIRNNQFSKQSFATGRCTWWAGLVLITAICVAQMISAVFLYSMSRNFLITLKIFQLNIFLATLSLFMMCDLPYVSNGLLYLFYYILPFPILALWALMGIVYIKGIFDENPFTNSLYALWHYCGILFLYNHATTLNVPWLW